MAASTLPSHIMVWKKSSEVNHMEEIQADDARRTVKGFKADNKFNRLAPKFSFDGPNKEEEDRLSKVCQTVIDDHQKIADSVQELVGLEQHWTASLLEKSWYDLDMCTLNLEQSVDKDLREADGRVMTLLDMKSRGVEILVEVERWIMARCGSIVQRTAWTKNGLPDSGLSETVTGPSNHVEDSENKRKAEESDSCAEGSQKKKKKKKVVESGEEDSTMG
ncbi:hypothetical protein M422DRAFT_266308 [Sphaerobolus stellatus SS14]|uniref:Uncharacterized protein n=1 Tax=Sphaerobolus stellatus (strain SS14) TaxID=990650 RepID=A0A0C9V356_SPHS4|nr:hypothetical protein M422DRAFT_266308 [Sphaerobolus stellatus SS14]